MTFREPQHQGKLSISLKGVFTLIPLLGFGTTASIAIISFRVSTTRDIQKNTGVFALPALLL